MFEDEIVGANTAVDNNVLITAWTQIRAVSQRPRRCVIPHAELVTQRGELLQRIALKALWMKMVSLKPLGVDRDKHVVVVDGRCFSNCRAVCLKADIGFKVL